MRWALCRGSLGLGGVVRGGTTFTGVSSFDDPEAARRRRQAEAKRRVAELKADGKLEERVIELSPERVAHVQRSSLPTSFADPVRGLHGAYDLVYPVHHFQDHVEGPGNDWLLASGQGFPQHLQPNGWVYLKSNGRLGARARALRVEYRENLVEHTPDDDATHAAIRTAAVIALDSTTWERLDAPAHPAHQQGYRYVTTDHDADTVTHLINGQPDPTVPTAHLTRLD